MINFGNDNQQDNNQTAGGRKKSDAFVNLRVPVERDGETKNIKLGTIFLTEDGDIHSHIIEQCTKDPEFAQKLVQNLVADFQLANQKRSPGTLKLAV